MFEVEAANSELGHAAFAGEKGLHQSSFYGLELSFVLKEISSRALMEFQLLSNHKLFMLLSFGRANFMRLRSPSVISMNVVPFCSSLIAFWT